MDSFLKASWQQIIMANYEVPPAVLLPYLPNGVEIDTYNNKVYVSLVGFMFKNTQLFSIPIPLLGNFEEINLRFYVTRKENNKLKRGVVFINETVPYKAVAWLANKLYHENYTCIPTKHQWAFKINTKNISYKWKKDNKWNLLKVEAQTETKQMIVGSFEEFIFEHYYGYAKISTNKTEEYEIIHQKWETQTVINYAIDCDFKSMYGSPFSFLNNTTPNSVFITNGSNISVKWKRKQL